ncbi:MAG: sodium/proton-translocating pyrophosphatase, partial [Thermoflexales bacterium]|nr:sodium/proton-translocating pyrophosphatase [Thermoflexales bacterium]
MVSPILFALGVSLVGLLYVVIASASVLSAERGNETMQQISNAVREGAQAFLAQEYRVLVIFALV